MNQLTSAVIIAVHKPYRMPDDPLYVPVHVGACRQSLQEKKKPDIPQNKPESKPWDEGFCKDDTGDNISYLNPSFCELTGLYWAWKNLDEDYIGLAHYRRHFSLKKGADLYDSILKRSQIEPFLGKIRVFVPKKRKYYIETLYSHYAHTHFAVQLDTAREMIEKKDPSYCKAYDRVVKQTWGYMFNMMILQKDLFRDYCSWLFDILFAMKEELGAKSIAEASPEEEITASRDLPVLSDFQARFYGRVSEILFNVWLEHQKEKGNIKNSEIMELGFLNLEGENWGKKITSFLKAKFVGKKYEQSF